MKITGTFIDEISHDIPHQNWGRLEWERDFEHMKNMGIERVILIRSGYRKWLTYPSDFLITENNCFRPNTDLVQLFLDLSAQFGFEFWFGTYDSGHFWDTGNLEHDYALNRRVVEEVWARYGHHPAFRGWYLSLELSRRVENVELYRELGQHCKQISGGLPVLMSPYIEGKKAVSAFSTTVSDTGGGISLAQHGEIWDEIFQKIKGGVDIVAFQDGHVDFEELKDFLILNKKLADKHGLTCWTNSESFDRDMPIKFLPIKWDKLRLKLEAAQSAGIENAITFEFSHFMSPQSAYLQAGHLYNRYLEYLNT